MAQKIRADFGLMSSDDSDSSYVTVPEQQQQQQLDVDQLSESRDQQQLASAAIKETVEVKAPVKVQSEPGEFISKWRIGEYCRWWLGGIKILGNNSFWCAPKSVGPGNI